MYHALKHAIRKHEVLRGVFSPLIMARRWLIRRRSRRFAQLYASVMKSIDQESICVRLPEMEGSFEVGLRSTILKRILHTGEYEPDLAAVLKKRVDPGRDVIDVGANVGFFSVLAAKLIDDGQRVLAIEPTPSAVGYLRRNIERNSCADRVIVAQNLVADSVGRRDLHVIPGKEEFSSLNAIVHPSVRGLESVKIVVDCETIDNLVMRLGLSPGLIKIDVEGAEIAVFRGAEETIRRHLPTIVFEVTDSLHQRLDRGTTYETVTWLEERGYRVGSVEHPKQMIRVPYSGEAVALPPAGVRVGGRHFAQTVST